MFDVSRPASEASVLPIVSLVKNRYLMSIESPCWEGEPGPMFSLSLMWIAPCEVVDNSLLLTCVMPH